MIYISLPVSYVLPFINPSKAWFKKFSSIFKKRFLGEAVDLVSSRSLPSELSLINCLVLVLVVLLAAAAGPEFSSSVSGNLCFVLVDLE